MTGINEVARQIHENAVDHGWWDEERGFPEVLALIHSEVSEALEEYRNGRLPTEVYTGNNGKPEGIPIELADVIIRVLDYCGYAGIDIDAAISQKHEYNKAARIDTAARSVKRPRAGADIPIIYKKGAFQYDREQTRLRAETGNHDRRDRIHNHSDRRKLGEVHCFGVYRKRRF